jgi:chlorobactene glucosyltransferase
VLAALALCGAMTLVNLVIFPRLRAGDRPPQFPKISVLVPARNEERRIGPCAESLAAQDYPNFEVLILNDNSTDDTDGVLRRAGFSDTGKLRILRGEPLPAGWMGKSWACHQLAQAASGEYLLFTDADTWHGPQMLAAALAKAEQTRADLLSAWPRQLTGTPGELLVIPMLYLFGFAVFPHALLALGQRFPAFAKRIKRETWRGMGGANGQFLLFRRAAYELIGGHAAVRGNMVEDLSLGREVAARIPDGLRLVNADGALSTCRMYTSFADLWEGFSKNARPAFQGSTASFLAFILLQWLVFAGPFFWLLAPAFRGFALMQVALILGMRFVLSARFQMSWLSGLLHPLGNSLMSAIALNSLRLARTSGLVWKGRVYQVQPGNDEVTGTAREQGAPRV